MNKNNAGENAMGNDSDHRKEDNRPIHVLIGMVKSLTENVTNFGGQVLEINEKLDKVLSAFPEGKGGMDGTTAHRLYHMKKNLEEEDARDLKQSLIKSLSTWGLLGTLTVIGAAVLLYLQVKFGRGPGE